MSHKDTINTDRHRLRPGRHRDTETHNHRHRRHRQTTHIYWWTQTDISRHRHTQTDIYRYKQIQTDTDRYRLIDTGTDRYKVTQSGRYYFSDSALRKVKGYGNNTLFSRFSLNTTIFLMGVSFKLIWPLSTDLWSDLKCTHLWKVDLDTYNPPYHATCTFWSCF